MFTVSKTVPVNPVGADPALDRDQIWAGLLMKARNALPFVAAMTHCEVLRNESPEVFVREIVFKGETMQERITLRPREQVRFDRLSGAAKGHILNDIVEDPQEGLALRFTFTFEIDGMPHGSEAERNFAASMEKDYLSAVQATVNAIRRSAAEGKLAA